MWQDVALFSGVFAVSASLPGPDTMLLFGRALGSGARAASTVAAGMLLGKLGLLTAALLGVTTAAAALGPWFVIMKVGGGCYLAWLAVRLWRSPDRLKGSQTPRSSPSHGGRWRGFVAGAVFTLGNPQALLFYVAVLPTILNGRSVAAGEYLFLCSALIVVMVGVAAAYILLAVRVRRTLAVSPSRRVARIAAVLLGVAGAVAMVR